MNDVIAEVVPLGLVVAASPFPVIPAILLLFTPRATATTLGFIVGWVIGIVAATTLFALVATGIEMREGPPTWASWARILLGLVLVVLGVRQWWQRHAKSEIPAWMESIDGLTPATALRLGLLLSAANPKIVLLAAAAGLAIGAAELGGTESAVAIVVFTVIASSTVVLPLVLYAVFGERILRPLARVRDWLQENNATVMSIVVAVIGAVLVLKGIRGL